MSEKGHISGFVSIIGKPNAGKSTLMNALIGRKLAIITPKAQTTRHRILGIMNGEGHQVVFSDTPGVILPQYRLHKLMMKSVRGALEDADLILLLIDVNERFPEDLIMEMAKKSEVPVILVLNKIDAASQEKVNQRKEEITARVNVVDTIAISATKGFNVPELKAKVLELLPEGPPYFDGDDISDRPERFFVTEIIREKIFLLLDEEVPYSCEVGVVLYEEKEDITMIDAEIHVERDSQKGILVGKKGSMIKQIGQDARKDIEEFLGQKVFLALRVRVAEGWKDNALRLRNFGYENQ
jgi:GTP-binding protein Era